METWQPKWNDLLAGRTRGWTSPLLRAALRFASFPYAAAVAVKNLAYDRLPALSVAVCGVPVVAVGNLTCGGTGKTPAVEYLARFYLERRRHVTILSRGYGSAGGPNDEAMLLQANLPGIPHLQGRNRLKLARRAAAQGADLILLDDGFQHRRLARDLDLVLVDATNPWGHGYCLPRGLLRETPSALRRAGCILLTRTDQVDATTLRFLRRRIERLAPEVPLAESWHAPQWLASASRQLGIDALEGKKVAALCGLGNPQAFVNTLQSLGASVIDRLFFPDHHSYPKHDLDLIAHWAGRLPADVWLVTTQKDQVKLRAAELAGRPLWWLRIALEITFGRDQLHESLLSVIPLGRGQRPLTPRADDVPIPPFQGKDAA